MTLKMIFSLISIHVDKKPRTTMIWSSSKWVFTKRLKLQQLL